MSRTLRAGLLLLGLLSLLDLSLPLLTDGAHPPMAVALATAAVGLASLALVISAWRGARGAVPVLVILRALSALAAVPAVVEPGVPLPLVLAVAATMLATIVGITLVLARRVKVGAR